MWKNRMIVVFSLEGASRAAESSNAIFNTAFVRRNGEWAKLALLVGHAWLEVDAMVVHRKNWSYTEHLSC
jgi:hypothetical protein